MVGFSDFLFVISVVAALACNALLPKELFFAQVDLLVQSTAIAASFVYLWVKRSKHRILAAVALLFFLLIGIDLNKYWKYKMIKTIKQPHAQSSLTFMPAKEFAVALFTDVPTTQFRQAINDLPESLSGGSVRVNLSDNYRIVNDRKYDIVGVTFSLPATYVVDARAMTKVSITIRVNCKDNDGRKATDSWPFKIRLVSNPKEDKEDKYLADSIVSGNLISSTKDWNENVFYLDDFEIIRPSHPSDDDKEVLLSEISKIQILLRNAANLAVDEILPCDFDVREIGFE